MLDKTWIPGLTPEKQPRYQPVTDCYYWPVLGSFNNWNIIILSHKSTTSEDFEEIHKVVLDLIGNNMESLVKTSKYSVINTTYLKKLADMCLIMFWVPIRYNSTLYFMVNLFRLVK